MKIGELPLFDLPTPALSRSSDPPTSHAAAAAVTPAMPDIYRAILEALDFPLTDEAMVQRVRAWHGDRWAPGTIVTARSRLYRNEKLVKPCDFKRRTSRGVDCLVWQRV